MQVKSDKVRALIIEDEALIAEELTERLSDLGYSVIGNAQSAEDGIAIAMRERPTLLLVDITLKGEKDGTMVVKGISQYLDTSVIYITAHSDIATVNRIRETEYDGFILKPFCDKELSAEIQTALLRYAQRSKA